jgi:hypothetical protein
MQLGRGTRVSFSLSRSLVGFFSGSTNRMSMVSLTLLFIEIRIMRHSAGNCI